MPHQKLRNFKNKFTDIGGDVFRNMKIENMGGSESHQQ